MSDGVPERDLLAAFFGAERAAAYPHDPAGVLGAASPASKAGVVEALQRELAEMAAHPFGTSPEAAEVRLVLQQCASKLLDQIEVAESLGVAPADRAPARPAPPVLTPQPKPPVSTPAPRAPLPVVAEKPPAPWPASPPAVSPQPLPPSPAFPAIVPTGLERDAARILSQSASVTDALRSLTALAATRGLPASAAQQAIANLTNATRTSGPVAPSPAPDSALSAMNNGPRAAWSATAAAPEDAGQVMVRRIVIAGGVLAALCVVGVVLILVFAMRGPGAAAPAGGAAAATPATGTTAAAAPGATAAPTAREPEWRAGGALADSAKPDVSAVPAGAPVTGEVALAQLREAVNLAKSNPAGAAAAFERGVKSASMWWVTHDPGTRVACVEAIIDYLYAVSEPEAQVRAIDLLRAPAAATGPIDGGQVWPTAWSGGALWRLSRERELPGAAVIRVQSLLTAAMGPQRPASSPVFSDGAATVLDGVPRRLLERYASGLSGGAEENEALASGWAMWARAAAAVWPEERARRAHLDALGSLLTHSPDSSTNRSVYGAIVRATIGQDWSREGDDSARARLVQWIGDPRVSTANLSLLTQTLVTRAKAEGVDITMVLSPGASDEQRASVREAYAKAWGLESVGVSANVAENLLGAVRASIDQAAVAGRPIDDLRTLVVLLRATQVLSGKTGTLSVTQMLPALTAPDYTPGRRTANDRLISWEWITGGGRGWAAAYVAERTAAGKIDILTRLDQDTLLSIMEADLLAAEAIHSAQNELREAARATAIRFNDQWAMLYGVLQQMPRLSRGESSREFLTRMTSRVLPSPRSPTFLIDARRATLERLLELLSEGDDTLRIDRLTAEVAEAVDVLGGGSLMAGAIADVDAADQALKGMQKLYRLARQEAARHVPNELAPLRLDQIERRRAGRLAASVGPVQAFAAEQVSHAETLAFIVSGEQPTRAAEVKVIIDEMQAARRASSHVFEQMKFTQRAVVQLWVMRAQKAMRILP